MNITCPQCGFSRDAPEDKLPRGPVVAKCPKCGCRFRFTREDGAGSIIPQNSQEEEEDIRVVASNAYKAEARRFEDEQREAEARLAAELGRNPWNEAPDPDGWLAAFYQTVIRVLFQAREFFGALSPQSQIWKPLAFFLVVCVFNTLVERAWGDMFYSFLAAEENADAQLRDLLKMIAPTTSLPLALLLRCGSLLLQLFVFSLLMFFAYRLVAPPKANFMLVYQVLVYSSAPWLLCVVPGIGSIAGTIWSIGCAAVGCRAAMRLNWPQTLAGFLPLIAILAPVISSIAGMMGTGL